jgi:hypothetical protein
MLFFGIAMIFIISPILTYFYGKLVLFLGLWLWRFGRTAGDSYRHLSSKTDTSWKIERWMIHRISILICDDHRRYIFILI